MTGMGTSAYPYIPDTLTEFIEAVGEDRAYVKLTHDIDAYDDPNYTGLLLSMIPIRATSVYSEIEGGCSIKNVTVQANTAIWFDGSNNYESKTITNINFLNWVHKKIADDPSVKWSATSTNNRTGIYVISQCKFSFKVDTGAYSTLVMNSHNNNQYNIDFTNCSFYFEYPLDMDFKQFDSTSAHIIGSATIFVATFDYCNFIFKNYAVITYNGGDGLIKSGHMNRCGIVFDTARIKTHSSAGYQDLAPIHINAVCQYSYIAFVNPNVTYGAGGYSPRIYFKTQSSNASNCLVSLGTSDMTLNNPNYLRGFQEISDSNLKSRSYLEGIGWLP